MVDFGSKSKRMEKGRGVMVVGEIVKREWGAEWVPEYFRMMNLLSQGLLLEQRGSENGGG
jgi:hypothetical protein